MEEIPQCYATLSVFTSLSISVLFTPGQDASLEQILSPERQKYFFSLNIDIDLFCLSYSKVQT